MENTISETCIVEILYINMYEVFEMLQYDV